MIAEDGPEGPSDEQLMAEVAASGPGGRSALTILVQRHHAPLLGFLYRMVGGDRALAEDLTQETFARVIRVSVGSSGYSATPAGNGAYDRGRPFKPWLYAIATNIVRDHFKSAAIRHSAAQSGAPDGEFGAPGDGDESAMADGRPGPEEIALAREQGQEIAAAIQQIAPEYRAAILLRFYGELSLQEIAEALDIPIGTVKSRLSVGCRRLRDLLQAPHEPHTRQGRDR